MMLLLMNVVVCLFFTSGEAVWHALYLLYMLGMAEHNMMPVFARCWTVFLDDDSEVVMAVGRPMSVLIRWLATQRCRFHLQSLQRKISRRKWGNRCRRCIWCAGQWCFVESRDSWHIICRASAVEILTFSHLSRYFGLMTRPN